MIDRKTKPMNIRLAFREEGELWNVYLALPNTLVGAKHVGSIAMGSVKKYPDIKNDFMALMKRVLANAVEEMTGNPPDDWEERRAPKGERSGNA